jgi:hydroxymethylpyrimidine/phosphomethylpyrimidine kinase
MAHPASPPVALTIAGSDNSAGAGAQADLKTFTAHRVYGLTALTCVVAEVPGQVSRIAPVELAVVREQVRLSLAAYPVAAIKTGMLHSREVIELVAELYGGLAPAARPPLVVDPVMVATSGARLLPADAVAAYAARLFPLATLVTPNLDEARVLLGGAEIETPAAMRDAGRELSARFGSGFLMKGGHFGGEDAIDWLCAADGSAHELRAPFTRGIATHGTGCTYSAAVTAGLAIGLGLEAAVQGAKSYVSAALAGFFRWEKTGVRVDALNHWAQPPVPGWCGGL